MASLKGMLLNPVKGRCVVFLWGETWPTEGTVRTPVLYRLDEAEYGTCMRLILGIRKELTLKVKQAEEGQGKRTVT